MHEPLPQDRFAEIRAREQAATKGPWIADDAELYQPLGDGSPGFWGTWIGETLNINDDTASKANAQFVAHAREDVPFLLVALTERDATIDELRIQLRIAEQRVEELAAENKLYERALGLNEAA